MSQTQDAFEAFEAAPLAQKGGGRLKAGWKGSGKTYPKVELLDGDFDYHFYIDGKGLNIGYELFAYVEVGYRIDGKMECGGEFQVIPNPLLVPAKIVTGPKISIPVSLKFEGKGDVSWRFFLKSSYDNKTMPFPKTNCGWGMKKEKGPRRKYPAFSRWKARLASAPPRCLWE
jgi:hypothetical protein